MSLTPPKKAKKPCTNKKPEKKIKFFWILIPFFLLSLESLKMEMWKKFKRIVEIAFYILFIKNIVVDWSGIGLLSEILEGIQKAIIISAMQ